MSTSSVNDTARVVETLSDEELLAWLRLAFVFRGRAREAVQLVAAFGLPETIFELPRAAVKDRMVGDQRNFFPMKPKSLPKKHSPGCAVRRRRTWYL